MAVSRISKESRQATGPAGRASDVEGSAGAHLRAIRLGRGLSLTEVATQADVTKGFLSQLERGLTSASVPTLLRICETLQVGVGDLFSYPDEKVLSGGTRIDMGGEGVA
jgi:transcriptional regulator with XRE-family HTH domain